VEYGSNRYEILINSLQELINNFMFGMGPGQFYDKYNYFSHNGFLTTGLDFGLPVLILVVALNTYLVIYLLNRNKYISVNYIFCLNIIVLFNDVLHEYIYFIILYIIYLHGKADNRR
jgi:hypothetical protein